MWVLFLEAGVALFLLVFIVWWTMFSGQRPNTPQQNDDASPRDGDGKKQP
jgi:hypothetical protein